MNKFRYRLPFVILSALLGCSQPSPSPTVNSETPSFDRDRSELFVHEAGRRFAGETVTAEFVIRNDGAEPYSIVGDKDITTDCTCAGVKPAARQINPGAVCTVTLSINVRASGTEFSNGGSITWRSPSGATRETKLQIRGHGVAPLTHDPTVLVFSSEEMSAGKAKPLAISTALPLDWSTFHVASESPHIRLGPVQREGNRASVAVELTATEGRESVDGVIMVTAVVADPQSPLNNQMVGARIQVHGTQTVEFTAAPRTLMLNAANGKAVGRVLLRGKRVAESGFQIRRVTVDAGSVSWKLASPTGSSVAVVELVVERTAGQGSPSSALIETETGAPARIALEWIEQVKQGQSPTNKGDPK
jgi:hypothetical protein